MRNEIRSESEAEKIELEKTYPDGQFVIVREPEVTGFGKDFSISHVFSVYREVKCDICGALFRTLDHSGETTICSECQAEQARAHAAAEMLKTDASGEFDPRNRSEPEPEDNDLDEQFWNRDA